MNIRPIFRVAVITKRTLFPFSKGTYLYIKIHLASFIAIEGLPYITIQNLIQILPFPEGRINKTALQIVLKQQKVANNNKSFNLLILKIIKSSQNKKGKGLTGLVEKEKEPKSKP